MVPAALLILMSGGLVVGAFLKLFADHRAFRRELREVKQEMETVLDLVGDLALDAGDRRRFERARRRLRPSAEDASEDRDATPGA